jgi:hypothetical protein
MGIWSGVGLEFAIEAEMAMVWVFSWMLTEK